MLWGSTGLRGQQAQPEGTWRGSEQDLQDDNSRVAGDTGTQRREKNSGGLCQREVR